MNDDSSVPVDRSKATCPKCGHADTTCTWQEAEGPCFKGEACCPGKRERFERYCRGCKYEWETYDVLAVAPLPGDAS